MAMTRSPVGTFFAGGTNGVLQLLRADTNMLETVAGRYLQPGTVGNLARFRGQEFGTVSGVAFDAAENRVYISESTRHRIHAIDLVDPRNEDTWTIQVLAGDGAPGFAEGSAADAQFREPTALFFDDNERLLFVTDTGNHVIRQIDLSRGIEAATVRTFAGDPENRGFSGDGGPAEAARFFAPRDITRCDNGDFFVADTGNNRVRRVASATATSSSAGTVTTVLGDGVAASSGQGHPANVFSVNAPLGLSCDALGNLFVTSTRTVRLLPAYNPADDALALPVVDGLGPVQTIYGAPPRIDFPESVSSCLTDVTSIDDTTLWITDCRGMLIQLIREPQ